MVFEHQSDHESQWSTMTSIASKIGCTAETLRKWVRQAERDQGLREGMTTDDRDRLKSLEREVKELR
jgi:transposase-like protein